MPEIADVMQSLNCLNAMNLDGGGSTDLFANGRTINRPSDSTGPRPVVSAVLVRDRYKKKIIKNLNDEWKSIDKLFILSNLFCSLLLFRLNFCLLCLLYLNVRNIILFTPFVSVSQLLLKSTLFKPFLNLPTIIIVIFCQLQPLLQFIYLLL